MYKIDYRPTAAAELRKLPAFFRARLLSQIARYLMSTPCALGSRIKLICSPAGDRVHQLRVGEFRVFYDVEHARRIVVVRKIARKGRKTTGEIL